MVRDEENAQRYFWEKKNELSTLFPRDWKSKFKICVDEYINERLEDTIVVSKMTRKDKKQERVSLHHLRRLVAGADQEWELTQQPVYSTECAKIDGALVWQGWGYVILTRFPSPSQPLSQSSPKEILRALRLVITYKCLFVSYYLQLAKQLAQK